MELIERSSSVEILNEYFLQAAGGTGHSVFVGGEAGVGKTSLVSSFIRSNKGIARIYTGACDSLFTPRPLGPLYDVAGQAGNKLSDVLRNEKDRTSIFAAFLEELSQSSKPVILFFEDIHWADEATMDFIKFLARRIVQCRCLFVLTYRDTSLDVQYSLQSMFGELPPDRFTKLTLRPLSANAVNELAVAKGYASGEKVYALTGGNPFYVTEILASYSPGIPERVKDSILTVFHSKDSNMKALWEILSILPSRIELSLVDGIEREFPNGIEEAIRTGVIIELHEHLSFKHELYRITIEESLSVYRRKSLHKKMLSLMLGSQGDSINRARLLHHAQFAGESELIVRIAPLAAKEASVLGAHIEASRFYQMAIDVTSEDAPELVYLLEYHAYECYLTNQITTAIASQTRALMLWHDRKDLLREGDATRFLSRLWWFEGNRHKAVTLAKSAIGILDNGFPTRERSLAYSNYAQLHMLADDVSGTWLWGRKAMDLAERMDDKEILAHTLNNIGSALARFASSEKDGISRLEQSLSIALEHKFQEHAARAFTNLSFSYVLGKKYKKARLVFEEGLKYCETHDLNSWTYYMLSEKVKMLLATGEWKEAEAISMMIYNNPLHPSIVRIGVISVLTRLKIRRGNLEEARTLLEEGKKLAADTGEAQRIIPILCAELELCWISQKSFPEYEVDKAYGILFPVKKNSYHYTELAYWVSKFGSPLKGIAEVEFAGPFRLEYSGNWEAAAEEWKAAGCGYEEALALANCNESDQKRALQLLNELGASAVSDRMHLLFEGRGIRNKIRGIRKNTKNNPGRLTTRQIDVLNLLSEGLPNKEIAERLFISPKTVDHHISAILSQLEVNSRAKAVLEAVKLGILK